MNFFVHESSYVENGCQIGTGTKIWYFSHVMQGAVIGNDCIIGQNVFIDNNVHIGNQVKIQNNVSLYNGVTCQDKVFIGPSATFTNVVNPRSFIERKNEFKSTLIKEGASIGANATIICGNDIGKYSFIGAGSVVTKNVPDYALMIGNPAIQTGWVCECGCQISFHEYRATCENCGSN